MPHLVKFGAFNTGTGAPASTVQVTGLGFQPRVVIFWWNGRTETVDTAGRASHKLGFGVGISASDRRCVTTQSADGLADAAADHGHYNDACIAVLDTAGAVDGLLDVQSMDSDGFTLVVDDQFAASYRVQYLALSGGDLTHYATGQFQEAGTTGNQDTTSLTFQPDCVLFFSVGDAVAPNATGVDSTISIGAAISSTKQAAYSAGSNDGAGTTQTIKHAQQGSQCITLMDAGVTAIDAEASFVSFLSNGFRLNWVSRASTRYIHFLALKGGNYDIGELLTQTDTTTDIVVSTGFTPTGGLFIAPMNTENTTTAVTATEQFSIGAFDSASSRGMMAVSDRDNVTTSEVHTTVDSDTVYRNESATGGTLVALMDMKSIDLLGFTCIMDDAETGQRFVWYIAFGPLAVKTQPAKLVDTPFPIRQLML